MHSDHIHHSGHSHYSSDSQSNSHFADSVHSGYHFGGDRVHHSYPSGDDSVHHSYHSGDDSVHHHHHHETSSGHSHSHTARTEETFAAAAAIRGDHATAAVLYADVARRHAAHGHTAKAIADEILAISESNRSDTLHNPASASLRDDDTAPTITMAPRQERLAATPASPPPSVGSSSFITSSTDHGPYTYVTRARILANYEEQFNQTIRKLPADTYSNLRAAIIAFKQEVKIYCDLYDDSSIGDYAASQIKLFVDKFMSSTSDKKDIINEFYSHMTPWRSAHPWLTIGFYVVLGAASAILISCDYTLTGDILGVVGTLSLVGIFKDPKFNTVDKIVKAANDVATQEEQRPPATAPGGPRFS